VLGFLPVSTRRTWTVVSTASGPFQSRAGFSPCLDLVPVYWPIIVQVVSIPCWVFSLSRLHRRGPYNCMAAFQSRAGFSPCLDSRQWCGWSRVHFVSIPCWVFSLSRLSGFGLLQNEIGGFNPVLGFLPVSTCHTSNQSCNSTSFNPVLGFLPVSTTDPPRCCRCRGVSIPCWVFSLSRPPAEGRRGQHQRSFNPVLGFLPVSTVIYNVTDDSTVEFQSRAGFSPCLDRSNGAVGPAGNVGFNPVLGFLPVSTSSTPRASVSRRPFQSRAGFSPCLDLGVATEMLYLIGVSIPCWVFSLSRHLNVFDTFIVKLMFQSRAGFSPCLDTSVTRRHPRTTRVSIPCWVFSLSRRRGSRRPAGCACGFNPVLGFLPVSTATRPRAGMATPSFNPVLGFLPVSTPTNEISTRTSSRFQSRAGFSPCLDPTLSGIQYSRYRVSIPCWVFSLSRPDSFSTPRSSYSTFQSRAGFSPCLDVRVDCADQHAVGRFNPVLGFLPVSTSAGDRPAQNDTLFQSRAGFSPCLDVPEASGHRRRRPPFQSRAGFSPCLDRRLGVHSPDVDRVSIPCWVFSLSRPHGLNR